RPDWQIVLIGPVDEAERITIVGRLGQYANIHLFGPRPYNSLPGYLKGIDVCLIPYALNAYTQGVFPMKFFEYMATGKPIVSTALPSLRDYEWLSPQARSYEEFVSEIEHARHDDFTRQERLNEAEQHTWETRVHQMLTIISKIAKKTGAEL
ncbi:MAG: glycosyltransferase, partial [Lentisphaerae bacterium]|nr:glycosyltransferase [Lentisphaerota bacterium]